MPMIEPVPAPEIFCSGLGKIENIGGGCFRFYLYVMQSPVETDGPLQKVLVAKLIAPSNAIPDAILKMIATMGNTAGAVFELIPGVLAN